MRLLLAMCVVTSACETSRSYVEIPSCADRVELEGQGTRDSSKRFELDHTFDPPFARTILHFQTADGTDHTYDVVSSSPDPLRMFSGAAAAVASALFFAAAVYDVTALEQSPGDLQPVGNTIAGAGLLAFAGFAVSTGWHPPHPLFEFPTDVCPAEAATPEPKHARKPKRPKKAPPPTSPTPAPLDGDSFER